jgi:inner membrane transporter RhtA
MSLEPAIALVVGFLLLQQSPGLLALLGVGFVVAAGVGAERTGARLVLDPADTSLHEQRTVPDRTLPRQPALPQPDLNS